jgi:hypothetical protein
VSVVGLGYVRLPDGGPAPHTQRHGGNVVDIEEANLRRRLSEIATQHIRCGRRMAYRLLWREAWTANH